MDVASGRTGKSHRVDAVDGGGDIDGGIVGSLVGFLGVGEREEREEEGDELLEGAHCGCCWSCVDEAKVVAVSFTVARRETIDEGVFGFVKWGLGGVLDCSSRIVGMSQMGIFVVVEATGVSKLRLAMRKRA